MTRTAEEGEKKGALKCKKRKAYMEKSVRRGNKWKGNKEIGNIRVTLWLHVTFADRFVAVWRPRTTETCSPNIKMGHSSIYSFLRKVCLDLLHRNGS